MVTTGELREPDVRPVSELRTDGWATGVSDHAEERYSWRATDGGKHAVRRAWAAGGELDVARIGLNDEPDAARYDPLTGTILIVRDGQVTTVIDADSPALWVCYADELERRGFL